MNRPEPARGEVFVLGYEGIKPSAEFLNLIQTYPVGGIIFFERNIASPVQLQDQIQNFRKLVPYPLFFMIDQEGGKVNRIRKEIPVYPSNKSWGDNLDFQGALQAYQVTATELRKLGINVNLAPVADLIHTQEDYIAERSFGTDPKVVSRFVSLAVGAIHSARILACAKHFPGLGNLQKDPHKELPEKSQSADQFRIKDFLPFQAAIDSKVEMIMTTHVKTPGLDPQEPATFSKIIVTEILRKELKFEGLVISDDMEMGGITKYFQVPEACYKAFLAGHDLILLCHSLQRQREALEYFNQKIRGDQIAQERLKDSLPKIERFKQRLSQDALV